MTIKQFVSLGLILVFTVGLVGCIGGDAGSDSLSPDQLGTIGAQIYENPDNAEAILENHELSQQEFKQKVKEVTEDPDKADLYNKAFQQELNSQ